LPLSLVRSRTDVRSLSHSGGRLARSKNTGAITFHEFHSTIIVSYDLFLLPTSYEEVIEKVVVGIYANKYKQLYVTLVHD